MKKQLQRVRVRSVSAMVALAFVANAAWAVDPFTVRDIRVEGLQRGGIAVLLVMMSIALFNDVTRLFG